MKTCMYILILSVFFISQQGFGQGNDAREKIEAARIALISERMGLTPEQAEKFWPVYNEYDQRRRELSRELQGARNEVDMNNITEEQSQQLMNLSLNVKERQLQLEKQYARRLTNIISSQQLLSLKKAEDDFRKMILRRLEERKEQQLRREQMRDRREDIIRNRSNN
ncbi:MAG: hypothetical protein KFF73_17055 [Cyclobacteriaceae bacterium]|nr:hypothetical protein [Cyclobacteriaceae bacterium]